MNSPPRRTRNAPAITFSVRRKRGVSFMADLRRKRTRKRARWLGLFGEGTPATGERMLSFGRRSGSSERLRLAPRAGGGGGTRNGHRRHHAADGRVDRRGDDHQVVEEGRRSGQARRADLRDLDRQGRRRDPLAGRRHAARDQGPGGRTVADQHRRRRRSARPPRSRPRQPAARGGRRRSRRLPPAPAARPAAPAPPRRRLPSRRPAAAPPAPAGPPAPRAAPPPAPTPVAERAGGQVESIEERIRHRSSPLVRKIAQEHAIEHRRGRGHRDPQPRDEERHPLLHREPQGAAVPLAAPRRRPRRRRRAAAAEPAAAPAPRPAARRRSPADRDEVVAMSKIRQITAENMILSKRTSAHVTTVFQVDYTNVARLRAEAQGRLPRRRTASS